MKQMCWLGNMAARVALALSLFIAAGTVKAEVSIQPMLAASHSHTCLLDANGAVSCWGSDIFGETASVAGVGVEKAMHVSTGDRHTCLTTIAGAAKCWGANYNGETGNSLTTSPIPNVVPGLGSNVKETYAGHLATCALLVDGTVRCIGDNTYGQLGAGPIPSTRTPIAVDGLPLPVSMLRMDGFAACALLSNGELWCWGYGIPQVGNSRVPVKVGEAALEIVSFSMNNSRTCFVNKSGAVRCWGYVFPELIALAGLESGVADVAVGAYNSCALKRNGEVWCDRRGLFGVLGPIHNGDEMPMARLADTPSGTVQVVVGGDFACTLTLYGGIKCWGMNNLNQLGGVGDEQLNSTVPASPVGLPLDINAISAAHAGACAQTRAGAVFCWGSNSNGQLGNNSRTNRSVASQTHSLSHVSTGVAVGPNTSCSVGGDGTVECWGDGIVVARDSLTPVPVDLDDTTGSFHALEVAMGWSARCVRSATRVRCQGIYSIDQVPTLGSPAFINIAGTEGNVTSLAVAGSAACAVVNGSAKCWGTNGYGELGDGTSITPAAAVTPTGLTSGVKKIAMSYGVACALMETEKPKCWGQNFLGLPGQTSGGWLPGPTEVPGLPAGGSDIAVGTGYVCVVLNGAVQCYGNLFLEPPGYYGDISGISANFPSNVSSISAAGSTICALLSNGSVKCLGQNSRGVLGRGTFDYRPAPKQFVDGLNAWGAMRLVRSPISAVLGDVATFATTIAGPSVAGAVDFILGGQVVEGCSAVPVVNATASCRTTYPAAGVQTVRAIYSGSSVLPRQTAEESVLVTGVSPSQLLLTMPGYIIRGDTVMLSVQVLGDGSSIPSGTVVIDLPFTNCQIQLDSHGRGGCSVSFLSNVLGAIATATYAGDAKYRASSSSATYSVTELMDFNANGRVNLVDALIALRYFAGFSAQSLIVDEQGSFRSSPSDIAAALDTFRARGGDIDLDGEIRPTTDILLVIRYLSGQRGADLVRGGLGRFAFRTNPSDIEAQLRFLVE